MTAPSVERPDMYQDGRLEIDFRRRKVFIDSALVSLTRKEYDLLSMLAAHEGRTVGRRTLLETVWGYRRGTRTRTLDVHICRLRKKLASAGRQYIETVFNVGARFERGD